MPNTNSGSRSVRRLVGGGLTGALVASGLLMTAAGAQAAAAPTVKILRASDIDFTQSRTKGHNDVESTGIHVYTDDNSSLAKAAAYWEADILLTDAGEPDLGWFGTSPEPGKQLVIDADEDGVADGILVGETVYGNDWWLTTGSKSWLKALAPSHTGGSGSADHGTLAQWRVALPTAKVLTTGYSLGSGILGDGFVSKMTVGNTEFRFTSDPASTAVLKAGDLDFSRTRANGHNKFLADGLHVYTDGSTDTGPRTDGGSGTWNTDKAAGYFAVNLPLAKLGEPGMDWVGTSPAPGKQISVDFNNDGAFDGFLVGESVYGNDWWLSEGKQFVKNGAPNIGSGFGSEWHGPLDQWRVAFPNAKALTGGYSLGSGIDGDGVISSMRYGSVEYRFANTAPVVAARTVSTLAGAPISVTLTGTDADADPLTFSTSGATNGALSGSGATVTFTPAAGFAGTGSFTYTADDGITSSSAQVTVTVSKRTSTTTVVVSPASPSTISVVKATVTVAVAGATATGAVTLKEGSKTLATATLAAGKVVVTLPSMAAGSHKLSISYAGSGTVTGSATSVTVKVVKVASITAATISPVPVKTTSVPKAAVTVSAPGTTATGVVTVREGSVVIGTGRLVAGKVTVTLKKLKKGTHLLTVKYPGDAKVAPSTRTVTVKVSS